MLLKDTWLKWDIEQLKKRIEEKKELLVTETLQVARLNERLADLIQKAKDYERRGRRSK